MVRNGYFPTVPNHPESGFSRDILEDYRVQSERAPRLSIQKYMNCLCDKHGVRNAMPVLGY